MHPLPIEGWRANSCLIVKPFLTARLFIRGCVCKSELKFLRERICLEKNTFRELLFFWENESEIITVSGWKNVSKRMNLRAFMFMREIMCLKPSTCNVFQQQCFWKQDQVREQ